MKRTLSVLLSVLMLLLLALPVAAAACVITVTVSGTENGGGVVTVTQSNAAIALSGSTYTVEQTNGDVIFTVTQPNPGFYVTMNGNPGGSYSMNPRDITAFLVDIKIVPFTPPSIFLSQNPAGGLVYSITNNISGMGASYRVFLCNGNGSEISSFDTSSATGVIALSAQGGPLTAGTSYTLKAMAFGGGGQSGYGALSAVVQAKAQAASYNFTPKATDGGKIESTHTATYYGGSEVALKATANTGYKFTGWTSENGSFKDAKAAETTFTMPSAAATVTANFKPAFSFTVMRNEGGTVFNSDGLYCEGETVRLEANAGSGYAFDSWASSAGGTIADKNRAHTTFTMPAGNVTVTATFIATATPAPSAENPEPTDEGVYYTLTAATAEGGTVVVNQDQVKEGQQVTVRANAAAGFVFTGWTSEGGGTFADASAVSTTFTMPANNVTLSAGFTAGGDVPASPSPSGGEDPADENKTGGTLWMILIIAGVAVIVTVAALMILSGRRKRRDAAEFDNYYDEYDENNDDGYGDDEYDDGYDDGGGYDNGGNYDDGGMFVGDRQDTAEFTPPDPVRYDARQNAPRQQPRQNAPDRMPPRRKPHGNPPKPENMFRSDSDDWGGR